MIGASDDDKFRNAWELPRKAVEFSAPIGVGRFPVTFQEWDLYTAECLEAYSPPDYGRGRGRIPVTSINWLDAQRYLMWLSAKWKRAYRLLTDAEWEYCCRAGGRDVFNTGSQITLSQANYLYSESGEKVGIGRPSEVGGYAPNAFGLYDMHGNVAELTADAWTASPGETSNRVGIPEFVAIRGGAWDYPARLLRSSYRDRIAVDRRLDNVGFRVAADDGDSSL